MDGEGHVVGGVFGFGSDEADADEEGDEKALPEGEEDDDFDADEFGKGSDYVRGAD